MFSSMKIFINKVIIESMFLNKSFLLLYLKIYFKQNKSSYLHWISFSLFNKLRIILKILLSIFSKN